MFWGVILFVCVWFFRLFFGVEVGLFWRGIVFFRVEVNFFFRTILGVFYWVEYFYGVIYYLVFWVVGFVLNVFSILCLFFVVVLCWGCFLCFIGEEFEVRYVLFVLGLYGCER